MAVLIFVFGALLALGLFFIAADFLKLPRLATQRAMLSVGLHAELGQPMEPVRGE